MDLLTSLLVPRTSPPSRSPRRTQTHLAFTRGHKSIGGARLITIARTLTSATLAIARRFARHCRTDNATEAVLYTTSLTMFTFVPPKFWHPSTIKYTRIAAVHGSKYTNCGEIFLWGKLRDNRKKKEISLYIFSKLLFTLLFAFGDFNNLTLPNLWFHSFAKKILLFLLILLYLFPVALNLNSHK